MANVDGIGFAGKVLTFATAADLSSNQYHLGKFSTDKVALAGAGEAVRGVILNKPKSTGPQVALGVLGVFPVMCDGSGTAIATGDPIKSDASGHGVKAATDKDKVAGYALQATAAAEVINVLVIPMTIDV